MRIQVLSYSNATLYSHRRFSEEANRLGWKIDFLNPDNFPSPSEVADVYLLRIGNLNYHQAFEKFAAHPQLPYINTLESFKKARDKWTSYALLNKKISMPPSSLSPFSYPCLLKICESSQGQGVFLLQCEEELQQMKPLLLKKYFFQKFISEAQGQDYRILMIGNNYVGAIKRHNNKNFKANIHQGGIATTWEAPSSLVSICQIIMLELGLHYAGLDFIQDSSGEYLFIEANPSPGFEAFEQTTKINFAKLLLESLHGKN